MSWVEVSWTWDDFHYGSFIDVNSQSTTVNDYSGKELPGVPPQVLVAGLDLLTRPGFYVNLSYTYSDRTPLNDANTAYSGSYNLMGGRIGFRKQTPRGLHFDFFVGGDNLFNVTYSLGNDFNAANGRYYNAAPTVNYFAGISFGNLFH